MYSTKFRELKTEIPVGMSDTFGCCQVAGRSGPTKFKLKKMGGVQVGAASGQFDAPESRMGQRCDVARTRGRADSHGRAILLTE